jgi:hypothetical protein
VSRYTSLGCGLWDWPRWGSLSLGGRNLWLALYTSPEAKRMPPGLWHGGVGSLAETAHVELHDAMEALDELLGRGMVEHDPATRVMRLTELPDRLERAPNGRCIRGWWAKFETVPACAVRDAHVELLSWLLEPMTADHAKAWAETFAGANGIRDRTGNGSGNRSRNGIGNGSGDQALSFPDGHMANRSRDRMRYGLVPDPEQDQDQGEEIQEGRGADGSGDGSPNGSADDLETASRAAGIPVCRVADPGLAQTLAGALGAWRPPPDVREARRVEAVRSASLTADRSRR